MCIRDSFILLGARTFSLVFQGVGGKEWIEHLLSSLPGGQVGFLIFANVFIFVIAFFLDFFEIVFIVIPLLSPVAEKLGIDLIWFGVLICANVQTSFMHPPFGFALFYLRSVAARVPYLDRITGKQVAPVTTGQIYWGAVPFVCIQVIMIALTIAFPQMVMRYKGAAVEPSTIDIKLPDMPSLSPLGTPPPDKGAAPANGGAPASPGTPDLSQPPSFGDAPAKPAPAPDLSQPPKFN